MKNEPFGTFSIVAFDKKSDDLGVAVASKFFAVGAVVPWAKAGVGAIATQSHANTTFGPNGLALLKTGDAPDRVLRQLTDADDNRKDRQVGIVDANGRAANFTGEGCHGWAGGILGDGFAVQGNILVGEAVVEHMAKAYETAEGSLADRLMAAMDAGEAVGGDSRGKQSAAMLVVREHGGYAGFNDRYIDLRVDDHAEPLVELRRLLNLRLGR